MCEYCKNDREGIQAFYKNDIGDKTSIIAAIIPKRQQLVFDYSNGNMGYTDAIDIKYCPFCGRKLQEGAGNV